MELYTDVFHSPIGELTIVSTENTVIELLLPGQTSRFTGQRITQALQEPILYTKQWLEDYFSGTRPLVDSRWLAPKGTAFQTQVWHLLLQIPYGQTVTYGQIAAEICRQNHISKMSAQAVGQAVGANPLPILIPCHRVVGAGGKLTGYAGGVDKKLNLLRHEGLYKEKVL